MKPEEAIEVLNEILDVLGHSHYSNSVEYIAVDTAIQALEKQISKPTLSRIESLGNHRYEIFDDCPNCKVDLRQTVKSDYLSKYCPECGQKINWEETP